MSRIGKKPIPVPAGVKVAIDGQNVAIEGKLGKLNREVRPEIEVSYDDESFSRAMYPFLAFGVDSNPECRFFVQVIDDTGPYKDAWQARLALVEGYFYKYWVK